MKFLILVGFLLLLVLEVFLIGWLGFGLSLKALLGHFVSHSVVLTDGQLAWNITKGIISALVFFPIVIWTAVAGIFGALTAWLGK